MQVPLLHTVQASSSVESVLSTVVGTTMIGAVAVAAGATTISTVVTAGAVVVASTMTTGGTGAAGSVRDPNFLNAVEFSIHS